MQARLKVHIVFGSGFYEHVASLQMIKFFLTIWAVLQNSDVLEFYFAWSGKWYMLMPCLWRWTPEHETFWIFEVKTEISGILSAKTWYNDGVGLHHRKKRIEELKFPNDSKRVVRIHFKDDQRSKAFFHFAWLASSSRRESKFQSFRSHRNVIEQWRER